MKSYEVLYQVGGEEEWSLGAGRTVKARNKIEAAVKAVKKMGKRERARSYDFHVVGSKASK
jgi:hypothetical protein